MHKARRGTLKSLFYLFYFSRCPLCSKQFTVKGNMKQHIMGVHLKQYAYYCPNPRPSPPSPPFSPYWPFFITILYVFLKFLVFEIILFFLLIRCPHCSKQFTVKGNMKQHIMGVHLKQYAYCCPICGDGYRRKKDMLLHMEQHKVIIT